ncbi:ABC transporter substrate-binding protein [Frankia sp. Mgl5]|uniref:ABC transporter substrate-binding protein n=1 Tax=Frankia sp. Mgl5 TaxID=2933793 RepID=UPI002010AE1F|nr:ABC transporter substrate-binding protein [Frankia sp. Mgl5]MCK9929836.1 ABC transporter substrate-binding protein [Frankia sp. Mgl5]
MIFGRLSMRWIVSVAIVVVVAGCTLPGSGKRRPVAVGCDSPGVTSDQVKLGLVFSDSGIGSTALSSARSGVDARINLANAEGGIHGRRIFYQWRDDASSSSQNALATQDLVQQESVFGLVAATASLEGSLARLDAQGIPVVGIALPSWNRYRNLFSHLYMPSPGTVARYIQAHGGTRIAVVTTGTVALTMETITQYKNAFSALGLAATDPIPYTSSSDSPQRIVHQLAAIHADALIGFTAPEDLAEIVQAARAASLRLNVDVSLTGYDKALLPAFGQALAGVSIPVYFRPFEAGGPAIDRYRDAMTLYAPESIEPDQQFAMLAYIYTDLFLHGLDLAGTCPTREGFIKALRSVTDYDADGLISPVDLSTNSTQPLDCFAFVRVNSTGTAFDVVHQRLCSNGSESLPPGNESTSTGRSR